MLKIHSSKAWFLYHRYDRWEKKVKRSQRSYRSYGNLFQAIVAIAETTIAEIELFRSQQSLSVNCYDCWKLVSIWSLYRWTFFQSDRSNHMETMLKRLSFPNCSWGNIPLDPTEHEKIIKSWLIQWGEKGVGEPGRIESGRRAGSGREKGGKWDK